MVKEKMVLGGAILAALVSSLCCITPLLFVLLGVGSFGAATMFEPLRPYLMGVAVLFQAVAYYWVYFKHDSSACAPGEVCETKPANRASRFGLWFATLMVILFALVPYITPQLAERLSAKNVEPQTERTGECCISQKPTSANTEASNNTSPSGNFARVTFTVTGMTCASCETTIKLALEKTPGVKRAEVSYDISEAVVEYDAKVITREKLRDVINSTGYKVKE